jgi:chemotaxis signal transduction protein
VNPVPAPRNGLAARLRVEFDAAFARPIRALDTDLVDLLKLSVGDQQYELLLSDIAQLIADPVFTALPTSAPALRGIAMVHGAVVVAYDLGVLLGLPPTRPSWMVTAAGEPTVGVTFDAVRGHRRIPRAEAKTAPLVQMQPLVEAVRALACDPQPNLISDLTGD